MRGAFRNKSLWMLYEREQGKPCKSHKLCRLKGGAEDTKIYDGIKYERKTTGAFTGKLVSQGTIINIDGEDYVEYRVLTRPSFF